MKKQDITKKTLATLALTGLCAGLSVANHASADEGVIPGNEYAFNACGSCHSPEGSTSTGRNRRYDPTATSDNSTPDDLEKFPGTIDDLPTQDKKTADATDEANSQMKIAPKTPGTPVDNMNGTPHASCNSKHGCHSI